MRHRTPIKIEISSKITENKQKYFLATLLTLLLYIPFIYPDVSC